MTSTPPPPPSPPPPTPPWSPVPAAALPPQPGPARPLLRRSRADRFIGGVSGGLADYSGIDALLWRVGFVALALAGPGVPVYLLLWLFMRSEPRVGEPHDARPAEPRSPVPGVTLAALLIVLGLVAGLAALFGWNPGAVGFLGTALLIVGLGLVAAAFTGGRRAKGGLITLGAVLSVALLASTVDWPDVEDGVGERTYRPTSAAGVAPAYSLDAGSMRLDLTDIDLAGLNRPIDTRLDVGVGEVEVIVPESADVRVEVDNGMGEVDVLDLGADGGFSAGSGASWSGDGDPEIVLDIRLHMGELEVSRA